MLHFGFRDAHSRSFPACRPLQGFPLRNDNLTNFAYVGNDDGKSPPEQYNAFHADQPSNGNPILPGMTTYFR